MPGLRRGRYLARFADGPRDLEAAGRLRGQAFFPADPMAARAEARATALAADPIDRDGLHVLIEECDTGALACCFRLLPLASGAGIERSYSAQFYQLDSLRAYAGPMLEVGRFCVRRESKGALAADPDPDILRVAWAALTRFVDDHNVRMLFGCSSFPGTASEAYADAFAWLGARHLAPRQWRPGIKAPRVIRFDTAAADGQAERSPVAPDRMRALGRMPPLLRTYLTMGGWVSDHAVVDQRMNTLHVFTGVELSRIPPARARLLRADASQTTGQTATHTATHTAGQPAE